MKNSLPTMAFLAALSTTACEPINWFSSSDDTLHTKCEESANEAKGADEICEKLKGKAYDVCESARDEIARNAMIMCMTRETNTPWSCESGSNESFECKPVQEDEKKEETNTQK